MPIEIFLGGDYKVTRLPGTNSTKVSSKKIIILYIIDDCKFFGSAGFS